MPANSLYIMTFLQESVCEVCHDIDETYWCSTATLIQESEVPSSLPNLQRKIKETAAVLKAVLKSPLPLNALMSTEILEIRIEGSKALADCINFLSGTAPT